MPYKALGWAIRDWWGAAITLGLMNLIWLVLLLPVVTAPPVTAAIFVLVRQVMLRQPIYVGDLITALRHLFWKSWRLALVSWIGVAVGVIDLLFYSQLVSGVLGLAGLLVLTYLLVIWCQAQCYAWAQLAWRPDLTIRQLVLNGLLISARSPLYSLVLTIVLLLLLVLSVVFAPLAALGLMALWASFCVQSVAVLVPELLEAADRDRIASLAASDAMDAPVPRRGGGR